MKIEEIVNKCQIGISPLTGRIYIFYPDKQGDAKYKKSLTEDFCETKKMLEFWLSSVKQSNCEHNEEV